MAAPIHGKVSFWNNNDPSGTTATTAWIENDSPIFAAEATYTVTASASHSIAGFTNADVTNERVTINSSGGSVLTLTSSALGQAFTTPSGLIVNAPLASDNITPLIWDGHGFLSLFGNNSALSGGIVVNNFGALRINNANSFGTGPITFGGGANVYRITSGTSSQAMTFNNAVTGPARSGADGALRYSGDHPVTFTNWTQGTGMQMRTNTFILGDNGNRTPRLILGDGTTGIKGDANSGLTVSSAVTGGILNGTLVVDGVSTYGGNTTIGGGDIISGYPTLQADDGVGLPTNSFLILNGGVLQTSGTFLRSLAPGGASNMEWNATGGGFSAIGSPLMVNIGGSGGDWCGVEILGRKSSGRLNSDRSALMQKPFLLTALI
jgi:hypothetical protein